MTGPRHEAIHTCLFPEHADSAAQGFATIYPVQHDRLCCTVIDHEQSIRRWNRWQDHCTTAPNQTIYWVKPGSSHRTGHTNFQPLRKLGFKYLLASLLFANCL